MHNSTFKSIAAAALLGSALLSAHVTAGVVTTLGSPTSTNNSIGNLPTWNNNGDTQDATFTSYIDFTPNTNPASRQLIWETGGAIRGASLVYSGQNTLYLRVLDSGSISELSWELTANQLNAGELFVSWVFDLGNDELRLFMNGLDQANNTTLVATSSLSATDWTGSGAAAFGDGTSRVGGYSGLGAFFPDAFSSGTINTTEGLDFYRDQAFLPSPVPEPLGTLAGVAAIGFTFFRRRRSIQ
jgi:hypothetical protein